MDENRYMEKKKDIIQKRLKKTRETKKDNKKCI